MAKKCPPLPGTIGVITFSEPWPKLKDLYPYQVITTIRWGSVDRFGYYWRNESKPFTVALKKDPLAVAEILSVMRPQVCDLPTPLLQADTYPHYTREQFMDLLRAFYSKKPDWAEEESNVTLIYLRIVRVIPSPQRTLEG